MGNSEKVLNNQFDRYYQDALRVEIELGESGISAPETYPPTVDLHPEIIKYRNKKITGRESSDQFAWIDFIFKDYAPKDLGLTLGSGTGKEAVYMQKKGFVKKWTSIDIVETDGNKLKSGDLNEYINGDLNFIELPENKFDVIICFGVLHHIINLEQLLYEINKALKADGVFLVFEYVGETKWNFKINKRNLIEELLNKEFNKKLLFNKRDMSLRPLESIRSEELPKLIDYFFGNCKLFEKLWNPILYPGINIAAMCRNITMNLSFYDKVVELMIKLNEENEEGKFVNTELIGLYSKNLSNPKPPDVIPWERIEIRNKLNSKGYNKRKFKRKIVNSIPVGLYRMLRTIKKRLS